MYIQHSEGLEILGGAADGDLYPCQKQCNKYGCQMKTVVVQRNFHCQ